MKIEKRPKSIFLFLFFLSLFQLEINAQENIPIGDWRMHISYRAALDIELSENTVFCATSSGIFSYSRADNSISTLTKLNGLTDNDITEIDYSITKKMLLIGYSSGNIDILLDNEIAGFSSIKESNFPDKSINHILSAGNNSYISTDFGLVILDLNRRDIKESYLNLGEEGDILRINYVQIFNDSIFLATEEGIIAGSLDPGINLQDFNNWHRFDLTKGVPNTEINSLAVSQDTLYAAVSNDGIYKYVGDNWLKEDSLQNIIINNISTGLQGLIISTESDIWISGNSEITKIDSEANSPRKALQDPEGNLWIADYARGIVTDFTGISSSILPSGPYSNQFFNLFYHDNMIVGLSGGFDESRTPNGNRSGYYVFKEGSWNNYFSPNVDLPADLVDIAFDQDNSRFIITSFGEGYVSWDGNDDFQKVSPEDPDYPFSSGRMTATHASTNVWISIYDSEPSIYFRGATGTWIPVELNQPGDDYVLQIISDLEGKVLFRVDPNTTGGIIVYDPDREASKWLGEGTGNGGLPDRSVNDLALDLDGNMWVGTNQGVAYYPRGSFESDQNIDAIRPVFEGRFLFNNEKVSSIAVDGGNRKWLGTGSGLWLFNEFGDELIYHFTIDNSPLLSNEITDIEINSKTGEVFIATPLGATSFRSSATEGRATHSTKVKVFPNPITANFSGTVGFEGLAADAFVKITDVSGRLIWQMQANGGTASWDLSTLNGSRPSTGIYLIFSSTDDGSDTFVGKFAIIN